ncbi:MAG: hypothetical protein KTR25_14570, partial [Myxococcales bacterium]|nr:hypothetical protein [Myxococcales bacterium]
MGVRVDGQDNKYERRSLLAGVTVAVLMIAQQVGAKATRDAFFLSEHGSAYLPQMMVASALLSLLIAGCMAKTLLSVGPGRSVMWAFAASAGLLLGEWFFASRWPKVVSMVFYLHLGALSPIVISGFWSVVNERFDPHAAKRHVTRIAASAAGGGALGGLLAERITASLSLLTMLPVLAVLNLLCAFIVPALVRGASPATAVDSSSAGPLRISGYLKKVAAVMVLTSTAAGLIDYAVKAQAASSITEPKELAAFFAYLHAMLGLLGFAVQSCVSGKLLKRAGLGATLALLPGAVVLGASLGAVFTRLWSVVVAKGLETSVRSSAFRSGYELLYIPVQRREKRAAKTIIDVGADRLGDIAAAGLAVLAIAFVPQAVVPFTLIAAVTVSLVSLALAFALQRGYVSALAASLRSGNLVLEEIAIEDATTAKTLADTMALNRDELIAEIEVLRRQSSEDGPIEATEDHSVTATTPHTPADTYFVRQVVLQRAHALL